MSGRNQELSLLPTSLVVWVSLFVPGHHFVQILVVLFEASELLLHQDTSTVVKVMSWQFLNILHSLPAIHSLLLALQLLV